MHDPYEDYYNELIKKVEKEGKIKVWVEYDLPFEPERLLSESSITNQRTSSDRDLS